MPQVETPSTSAPSPQNPPASAAPNVPPYQTDEQKKKAEADKASKPDASAKA